MTITHRIATAITNFEFDPSVEKLILARARNALIDSVAVAVAAQADEGYRIAEEASSLEWAPGESSLLVRGRPTTAAMAAFLNGYAIHALDYDDVSDTIYGHPSSVILPPLLAVAEARRRSFREVLRSYAVGYDTACVVAEALPVRPHYSHGWHATATVGVIGAAAGMSYLLGLSEKAVANALGIAATTASGSRQNFGSMTKPFHAAHAARDGVVAVQLAERGFTSDAHALDGKIGYFHLLGGDVPDSIRMPVGDGTNDLAAEGLNVKGYPCCYNTHRSADAARALFGTVDIGSIDEIRVTVEPHGLDPLIHHQPTTGTEAKFCLEYVVASALVDGVIGLRTFDDAQVNRPQVQDLLRKVVVVESETPPRGTGAWEFAYSVVEVVAGGRVHAQRVDFPSGHRRSPLTDSEIDTKFLDCFAFAGRSDGEAALAALRVADTTGPFELKAICSVGDPVNDSLHISSAASARTATL